MRFSHLDFEEGEPQFKSLSMTQHGNFDVNFYTLEKEFEVLLMEFKILGLIHTFQNGT